MVGLIWMVQVVHYNLFDRVGVEEFVRYESDHTRLITPIVMIPMLIELATAVLLVTNRPEAMPVWGVWAGLIGVMLIWASTFFIQVPAHNILMQGFDQSAYRTLVSTNWIRTFLWTARGALLGFFALRLLDSAR